jgi:threonylcarbamoyladenosine tRNA methylthiotransferase MtaB
MAKGIKMKKKIKFYTLGCKTNQYETQAIKEVLLRSDSYEEARSEKESDIFVVNTCTVTAKADKESRRTVRHCHRENPDAKIVVTGCLAENDEAMISGLPGVAHIVKNCQKHEISKILSDKEVRITDYDSSRYTPLAIEDFDDRDRAFVKVQDGCDNFCSYCKIPLVRGRSRSRPLKEILEEVERLIDRGFKELVLTGICLGDWGKGLSGDLKLHTLIKKISSISKNFRVRLSSIEPNMITDELIACIADTKKVCPHLHIPLQSGSDKILRQMKRPYSAKEYTLIIARARKAIKDLSITSDVLIGFPGESRRDFRQTVNAVKRIMPSRLHIFSYSQREGTLASRIKGPIDPGEIKRRREVLEKISGISSYKYRRRFLNKRVEGLIETRRDTGTGMLTGYTETYIKFFLDGPDTKAGKLLPLKINNVELNSTYCVF